MKIINAKYDGYSHDIIIGNQISNQLILYLNDNKLRAKLCIITDKNVANYHLSSLLITLKKAKIKTEVLILRPGENTITLDFSNKF